jgi:hypothetical protein
MEGVFCFWRRNIVMLLRAGIYCPKLSFSMVADHGMFTYIAKGKFNIPPHFLPQSSKFQVRFEYMNVTM